MVVTRFFAANQYQTTLSAAINAAQTTFDVVSVAGRPMTPFKVSIGPEILDVVAVTGLTFTVVRGAEGTAPASHVLGAAVENRWTAGTLDGVFDTVTAMRRQAILWSIIL